MLKGFSQRCFVCRSGRNVDESKGERISLHRFPRDKQLQKMWIKTCKLHESYIEKENKHIYICSKHFIPTDFIITREGGRRQLKPNAIPFVYRLSASTSRLATQSTPQTAFLNKEYIFDAGPSASNDPKKVVAEEDYKNVVLYTSNDDIEDNTQSVESIELPVKSEPSAAILDGVNELAFLQTENNCAMQITDTATDNNTALMQNDTLALQSTLQSTFLNNEYIFNAGPSASNAPKRVVVMQEDYKKAVLDTPDNDIDIEDNSKYVESIGLQMKSEPSSVIFDEVNELASSNLLDSLHVENVYSIQITDTATDNNAASIENNIFPVKSEPSAEILVDVNEIASSNALDPLQIENIYSMHTATDNNASSVENNTFPVKSEPSAEILVDVNELASSNAVDPLQIENIYSMHTATDNNAASVENNRLEVNDSAFEIRKRMIWRPSHASQLRPEHFSTPKQAKHNLDMLQTELKQKNQRIKVLSRKTKRLQQKISALKQLVKNLK